MSSLTLQGLLNEAKLFCETLSRQGIPELFGVTDGKAVGTYLEQTFRATLETRYYLPDGGNSALGLDLPCLNTDIKTTSLEKPQSSCPFKSARQKVYGLGYNILLFVYGKHDDQNSRTAHLSFVSCAYIDASRTADYQVTRGLNEILSRGGNRDDIVGFLQDRMLPVDDIGMEHLAEEILSTPPKQGYLTISNALQWRLQYSRVVSLDEAVNGIIKIVG